MGANCCREVNGTRSGKSPYKMDWLKNTVGKLVGGGDAQEAAFRERRHYLRTPCVERVMCVINEEAVSVQVMELSLMGMRVRIPRKVEVEDVMTFRAHREFKKAKAAGGPLNQSPPPLPMPGMAERGPGPNKDLSQWGVAPGQASKPPQEEETESEPVPFKARVVWVKRRTETSDYEAGLAFTEISNRERDRWTRGVLKAAGAPDITVNRRGNVRIACDLALSYRTPSGYVGEGRCEDLSVRGLAASVKMEIVPNTELILLISAPVSGLSVRDLRGRVTRCKKGQGDTWMLGVIFDDPSAREKKAVQKLLEAMMKVQGGHQP
jgi:hypothetical protein